MLKKLLLTALMLAGYSTPLFAQDAQPCIIHSVEGRATVSPHGAARYVAAVGLDVGADATLRTTANARVTLLCPDDLRVVVGPGTAIAVARLVPGGPQPVALRLIQGIAGFLFDGGADGVQVSTPSAVAAVRSTQWAMQVENGATAVFAREGAVFVLGTDATVRLTPGEGVDVSPEGDVGPVVQWGQARIDLFSRLLGPAW